MHKMSSTHTVTVLLKKKKMVDETEESAQELIKGHFKHSYKSRCQACALQLIRRGLCLCGESGNLSRSCLPQRAEISTRVFQVVGRNLIYARRAEQPKLPAKAQLVVRTLPTQSPRFLHWSPSAMLHCRVNIIRKVHANSFKLGNEHKNPKSMAQQLRIR